MDFFDLYHLLRENLEQPVPTQFVSYTAVVLYELDKRRLLNQFQDLIPPDWDRKADHMTINIGEAKAGPAAHLVGKPATVEVRAFAINELVCAVRVESEVPSQNTLKHITLAINPNGGSSKDSNQLKNWKPVEPFKVRGVVKEVEQVGEVPKIRVHTPQSTPAPNNPTEFVRHMRSEDKPLDVIRRAMKGKFPGMTDDEIETHLGTI